MLGAALSKMSNSAASVLRKIRAALRAIYKMRKV